MAIGGDAGYVDADPDVIQDTNNVVVWLRPHPVIAKVGVRPPVRDALRREFEVCVFLHGNGAPVGRPLEWSDSGRFPVSLWRREDVTGRAPDPVAVAEALSAVHAALHSYTPPLPSSWAATDEARAALADDRLMSALPGPDLTMLREAAERAVAEVRAFEPSVQPIHGEPHEGNVLDTASGVVLIDFEAVSVGPIEWDLACAPPAVADAVQGVDRALVEAARHLNNVRVATWCWASLHPEMRRYGIDKIAEVRAWMTAP